MKREEVPKPLAELECPDFGEPVAVAGAALEQRRVCCISTAGLMHSDDRPFSLNAADYRIIDRADPRPVHMSHIPTVVIGLIPQNVEQMRPPRALLVPFPLGRPLGVPNDRGFQAEVVGAALCLAERTDVPVAAWFEREAPEGDPADAEVWICPVSFVPPPSTDESLAAAVRAEIDLLRPWSDRAVTRRGGSAVGASGMDVSAIPDFLGGHLEEAVVQPTDSALPPADRFKLAAEDLKLFYLEAASAQPGADGRRLADWFWTETAAARLLWALQRRLQNSEDEALRTFVRYTLIPADRRSGS